MKILREQEEFIGKIIIKFERLSYDKFGIIFHDGSIAILESWCDIDGCSNIEIFDDKEEYIENEDLLSLDIISQEEYERRTKEEEEENEKSYRESRYQQYLKLKNEFEKGTD